MKRLLSFAMMAALALAAAPAMAAPTIVFGENQTPNGMVVGAPVTAHNTFISSLQGVSTADFENLTAGTSPPYVLPFTGSSGTIDATVTGGGLIDNTPTTGAYATSGAQFYDNNFSAFTISFSGPVSAFGFYGTDIGDVGESLTIDFKDSMGNVTHEVVPNTVNGNDGSLLYYGFFNPTDPFVSVSFAQSNSDRFGFDDMTIGDAKQIISLPGVPEPSVWAMLILGMGMVGGVMRRDRSSQIAGQTAA